MSKTCISCLGSLDISRFQKNSRQADGLKTICKRCVSWRDSFKRQNITEAQRAHKNTVRKEWRARDVSATKERNKKEWQQRVKKRNNERPGQPVVVTTRIRHNIDAEIYHKTKNSPCSICGIYDDIVIDHDHSCCGRFACEKCFRGGLCQDCNKGLGNFKDNIYLLHKAIGYLEGGDAR